MTRSVSGELIITLSKPDLVAADAWTIIQASASAWLQDYASTSFNDFCHSSNHQQQKHLISGICFCRYIARKYITVDLLSDSEILLFQFQCNLSWLIHYNLHHPTSTTPSITFTGLNWSPLVHYPLDNNHSIYNAKSYHNCAHIVRRVVVVVFVRTQSIIEITY